MSVTLKPSIPTQPHGPQTDPSTEIPSPQAPRPARLHGLALAGLVGLLAVGTGTCVIVWLSSSSPSAPTAPANDLEVYQPGGSVYQQQVPSAASRPDPAAAIREGYGPGSSTYSQQVPGAATNAWTEGYAPGSSTYSQQVPSAAR